MRIAIIGKKFPFCGIVTYCRELIRALRAQGHTVAFYYLHNEEVVEDNEDGLPYLLKTHVYILPQGDAKARLTEHLRQFRPDVVHASYALSFLDLALPDICDRLGVPLVATFHPAFDSRPSFHNRLSAIVYRMYAHTLARCDRVVVFSEGQRERLAQLKVPRHRIEVLPNGVDVTRYRPGASAFKREVGARRLITFMGRVDPEKNVGTLCRIFTELELAPDVHLAVMGDGTLGTKLRARYEDHPRIHWLGFVGDEAQRIDVLRGSDLFVLPSTVEGLSLALLEAMACGAVPVATDVGADGEVVARCGAIVDPGKLDAELGPAIARLLSDDAELARLKGRTRRRVVHRYGFSQNVERLMGIYDAAGQGDWRIAH
jgi:glycosyltransferase involved in cell wall biosynthesis